MPGRRDPEALMLVMPSDHVIPDAAAFRAAVLAAADAARAGQIVTFGIRPTRPKPAMAGWNWGPDADGPCLPLRALSKSPMPPARRDAGRRALSVERGDLPVFGPADPRPSAAHAPDLWPPCPRRRSRARGDLDFLRLDRGPWAGARDISIDYAVMERARNLVGRAL
jgi:mannose-1-phosphate guanylyltransferase / mannose-6-phosphate isomerase